MWSYLKRNYLPGRTGSPKMFMGTLVIPDNAFDGLSTAFTEALRQKYAKNDKKFFQYIIAAGSAYIFLRDTDDIESVIFLTDGTVSGEYTEFRQTWLVKDFEDAARYHAPELAIDRGVAMSYEELIDKIALNETFRDTLKYQIRALKWSQFTAFKINFGYLPAHYTVRLSPLRFVDVPKIRTITTFGEKVVLANSSYVFTTSKVRIWAYEKIIELLEVRLRCYNELAKGFPETPAGETRVLSFPPWYSEVITGYWDIAGLPRIIAGTFFGPASVPTQARSRPAVLSLVRPETEDELWGWYLSIGETASSAKDYTGFSIFVDPRKSHRVIYSRNGKTPEEKKLQLDCTLYINPGVNTPVEWDIVDRMLKPLIKMNDQGIPARIIFDGNTFEIRQHPARYGNGLIFRGGL
jgi:hypothetical protein